MNGIPLSMIPSMSTGRLAAMLASCMHAKAVLDALLLEIPLATQRDTNRFQDKLANITHILPDTDSIHAATEADQEEAKILASFGGMNQISKL